MPPKTDFSNIGFADFQRMASDSKLSRYEKIGFPDTYREGQEEEIFLDICAKLTNLSGKARRVVDIGPGCSDLPFLLIDLCARNQHALSLLDGKEMLSQLPDSEDIQKIDTLFPNCPSFLAEEKGRIDAILCYSVLHYVFEEGSVFRFLDEALSLLAPGGQLLIGDIPNISKRKRFFASDTGADFHRAFMKTDDAPDVRFNVSNPGQIDDAAIFGLLQRARSAGFDAYVVPQSPKLPMANRREDILIVRP
ncbi:MULTISPECIES: class I SAM-dependent methyltransferase [unclassified Ruegeria]|uniref:class I SAM-dependent methyltransferase n=1 Tax=unclassified Ruegeria TaxID=2625375 RepID=UPI001AE85BB1|nr:MULTISPECIES: class I SAM-dependent methyltransferase [unclassified Ruegeria]